MTDIREQAHGALTRIIAAQKGAAKWLVEDAKFAGIRIIPNTNVGKVGEAFAVALLHIANYKDAKQNPEKTGAWDVLVNGKFVEVKCASEDVGGSFQFNHVRSDREYDILLLVGIAPAEVLFRFYQRVELPNLLTTNMAKTLKGNYKFTHGPHQLFSIDQFPAHAAIFLGGPPRNAP